MRFSDKRGRVGYGGLGCFNPHLLWASVTRFTGRAPSHQANEQMLRMTSRPDINSYVYKSATSHLHSHGTEVKTKRLSQKTIDLSMMRLALQISLPPTKSGHADYPIRWKEGKSWLSPRNFLHMFTLTMMHQDGKNRMTVATPFVASEEPKAKKPANFSTRWGESTTNDSVLSNAWNL